jgi:hypothetical protein
VIFGKQGDVECPSANGSVVKADLVGQRRLAGAGRALDDIEATLRKPPFRMVSRPPMPDGTRSM